MIEGRFRVEQYVPVSALGGAWVPIGGYEDRPTALLHFEDFRKVDVEMQKALAAEGGNAHLPPRLRVVEVIVS